MRLLVLGGTVFLGRHIAEQALERGHSVTLYHRGVHGIDLFPGVDRRLGNRDGEMDRLGPGEWDACVDTCGYVPRVVRQSLAALADRVGSYHFVSSVSVYSDFSQSGITEEAAVLDPPSPDCDEVTGETYGPLKVACERAVLEAFGDRAFVVRPGLIVGPHDPTDRFTYWPLRMARGGCAIAPTPPEAPVQVIDVRDLASWILDAAERSIGGVFNAVGPSEPLTFGELLEVCADAAEAPATWEWVDGDWLQSEGVAPWTQLPLWLGDGAERGMDEVNCDRAVVLGLERRPIGETVAATLAWAAGWPGDRSLRAGLTGDREAELLNRWRARGLRK